MTTKEIKEIIIKGTEILTYISKKVPVCLDSQSFSEKYDITPFTEVRFPLIDDEIPKKSFLSFFKSASTENMITQWADMCLYKSLKKLCKTHKELVDELVAWQKFLSNYNFVCFYLKMELDKYLADNYGLKELQAKHKNEIKELYKQAGFNIE